MADQIATTPKQVGDALRRRRRSLGMTQRDIAGKTNLRQATISSVEAGESGTLRTFFDVLTALDMEVVVRQRTTGSTGEIEDPVLIRRISVAYRG
jgi:HTH-type transcriptional regulator/antitoxin HipB